MPDLHWALLCQQAITDRTTNAISYLNAVEELTVESFPAQLPPITVSTIWRRKNWTGEPEEGNIAMRIRITGTVKEEITSQVNQEFGSHDRYRINRGIGGIPVTEPGVVNFHIEHKDDDEWNERFRIPLRVNSSED